MRPTVFKHPRCTLRLRPQSFESGPIRERLVSLAFDHELTFNWKTLKLTNEINVFSNQDLRVMRSAEQIRLTSSLADSIAPTKPIFGIPVSLFNTCLRFESLTSWRLPTICLGDTANHFEDLLLVHHGACGFLTSSAIAACRCRLQGSHW